MYNASNKLFDEITSANAKRLQAREELQQERRKAEAVDKKLKQLEKDLQLLELKHQLSSIEHQITELQNHLNKIKAIKLANSNPAYVPIIENIYGVDEVKHYMAMDLENLLQSDNQKITELNQKTSLVKAQINTLTQDTEALDQTVSNLSL